MTRALLALLSLALVGADAPPDFAADAVALDRLLVENYAYADRLPGGVLPDTPVLMAQRAAVHDRSSLLHYAEDRLATIADHHASTGASFKDSWSLVPTYADLWIEEATGGFSIEAVRPDSPAARAGIAAGDRLTAIGGVPVAQAVADFWHRFGLRPAGERASYAARVLAAGRRYAPRVLTVVRDGVPRTLTLATLYVSPLQLPPVAITRLAGRARITIGNALGDGATTAGFDAAMATLKPGEPLTLDLRETPSGGNTRVARAIMGWFVRRPTSYQVHRLPGEERETGIARQWIEQVLPRVGRYHGGSLTVVVGRWTGSMGEGLAIGFAAIGASVCGGRMAGLRGAIYDFTLPSSGLVVKFPAERLYTVDGQPRERVVPRPCPVGFERAERHRSTAGVSAVMAPLSSSVAKPGSAQP